MKINLLLVLCLTASLFSFSQDIKRVEISGKIVVNSEDLENVTIFNTSSNRGTLTDENGKFKIEVALFDILEVRALQFQDFTVTIDKNIIASKKATIFLVEQVNKLNEVVILPYDLTGNLLLDMESVRTFNPDLDAIYFGISDITAYEFPDDEKSKVDNIAARLPGNDLEYQMDVVAIVGMLLKPRFRSNKEKQQDKIAELSEPSKTGLRDYYGMRYIVDNFKISLMLNQMGLIILCFPKEKKWNFWNFYPKKVKSF